MQAEINRLIGVGGSVDGSPFEPAPGRSYYYDEQAGTLVNFQSNASSSEVMSGDRIKDWADDLRLSCEEQYQKCVTSARMSHLAGSISDEEYRRFVQRCRDDLVDCQRMAHAALRALQRAGDDADQLRRILAAIANFHDCIARALQLPPEEWIAAIARCRDGFRARLSYLDLERSSVWETTLDEFLPTIVEECPCCIRNKADLELNTNGSLEGAAHYDKYVVKPWPKNFPDDVYTSAGVTINRYGGTWAAGVEISIGWYSDDCICNCTWTQFVSWDGGDWFEDRVGFGYFPTKADRRVARSNWKGICKKGRLYMADIVQQRGSHQVRFRTVFFPSSVTCRPKWVSIDWMIASDLREGRDGMWYGDVEVIELGRDEG